jgi:glycosyltransferase involved in cell wall biosynthesis
MRKGVVILISSLEVGGAEKQSILLSMALSAHYNVTLFVLYGSRTNSKQLKLVEKYGVECILLNGGIVSKGLSFRRFVQLNSIDIVFCFLPRDNLFAGVFLFLSKCNKVIGGVRLDGNPILKNLPLYIMVKLRIIKYIIFNSYASYDSFLLRDSIKDFCLVIHNCIEGDCSPPKTTEKLSKGMKILSVGRFVKNKDYHTALSSIKKMNDTYLTPNFKVKYIIVGYGDLENNIKQWVQDLNLNDIVTIVLNPEDISSYYDDADVYLSTSLKEGLSNSIMEAMLYSLPIVATNVGDTSFLVKDKYNGFLCKPKDINFIANKLYEINNDSKLRIDMGHNSCNIISNDFNSQRFVKNYIEFINNLN